MAEFLRVLFEYPGVGRPHDLINASEVRGGNVQPLIDAGIVEWVEGEVVVGRRALIETTESTPVRETAVVVNRDNTVAPRRAPLVTESGVTESGALENLSTAPVKRAPGRPRKDST